MKTRRLILALALLAGPAVATEKLSVTPAAKREASPFPVAAIVEELRRVSGDSSFAKKLDAPPPPAPEPTPTPPDKPVDEGGSDEKPPVAEDDTVVPDKPSEDPFDDGDFSSKKKGGKARTASAEPKPAPGSMEEYEQRRQKQADQMRERSEKQSTDYRKSYEAMRTAWFKAFKEQKERWYADRARFLKSIPSYKAHLVPLAQTKVPGLPKASRKPVPTDVSTDAFVLVNGGMEVPIRDQADRGTCAAFAGVRALEVAAKGQGRDIDLSEQFFYWLSKPTCQQAPCAQGGSWVAPGYAANLDATDLVIPEETDCPYNGQSVEGNDTQVPLADKCSGSGAVRLSGVSVAYTMGDVLGTLVAGRPVVVASTLSENFFKSKGLVTQADAAAEKTRDSQHAGGHAYLAVGFLALPESMQKTEGSFCLLIANSWGEGWGAGGYSCVTEAWFTAHRFDGDFYAPAEMVVK